ncbi:uncharacterized protein TNCV_930691 [Trichonephila clavipes]|uniref:DUF5641 domain-containing protein n=1 Tax=Trichonephila clavipes TaxID=2585209 RepID=A0A8X7BCZ0_TRICX|nr:uncharacterized protein TNCV_930691 [Trichonephila clavipes]
MENQLVLLKVPNTKPLDWPMGRILEVSPGSDGLVRVVNGKTSTGSLAHGFTRHDQTLLARFRERSGHIKTMKFSEGCKSFEMCTNCSSEPATPADFLECLGLTKQDLADDPLLVLDFLKAYDVMDLVKHC